MLSTFVSATFCWVAYSGLGKPVRVWTLCHRGLSLQFTVQIWLYTASPIQLHLQYLEINAKCKQMKGRFFLMLYILFLSLPWMQAWNFTHQKSIFWANHQQSSTCLSFVQRILMPKLHYWFPLKLKSLQGNRKSLWWWDFQPVSCSFVLVFNYPWHLLPFCQKKTASNIFCWLRFSTWISFVYWHLCT